MLFLFGVDLNFCRIFRLNEVQSFNLISRHFSSFINFPWSFRVLRLSIALAWMKSASHREREIRKSPVRQSPEVSSPIIKNSL